MEKSKVYFADARSTVWHYDYSLPAKLEELIERGGLRNCISKGDKVAIKIHFGSHGAYRVIRPIFVRKTVEAVKRAGGIPFVTDTTRIDSLEYLEVAAMNGFTHHTCGAPVLIADGIAGMDATPVKIEGAKYIKEISVANSILQADAMIVMSHFKGHIQAGFGGAIKHLGMGGISPHTHGGESNRGRLHSCGDEPPKWIQDKCKWCKICEDICPTKAITIIPKDIFEIDDEKCWRCGRCARVCKEGALEMPITVERLAAHLAESSKAVMSTFKPGKVSFMNFMTDIQPECDCMPTADAPVINDRGITMSNDPVAVDKASLDLVDAVKPNDFSLASDLGITERTKDILGTLYSKDSYASINAGVKQGLGNSEYELITIKKKTKKANDFKGDTEECE